MNKTLKNILITVVIIIGIIFSFKAIAIGISESLSSASKSISSAIGTDCEKKRNWTIGNYKIQENECIGLVGPHFRKFNLFENEEIIEEYVSMTDSCTVNFQKRNDLILKFNLCSESITELNPPIIIMSLSDIDSIQIESDSLGRIGMLSYEQRKRFIKDWNEKRVIGYSSHPFDSAFSSNPAYHSFFYRLIVFSNNTQSRFYGRDNKILDSLNWEYQIGIKEQDYFNKEFIK
ncbi:hypothetical protein ACFSQJ_10745 [Croceitalea marina]|uniref:YARHG domain-containing protein n=1 Tax=Croceitalea marina TaxID=1775166 RepID=A0ABW5MWL9_9FLAO